MRFAYLLAATLFLSACGSDSGNDTKEPENTPPEAQEPKDNQTPPETSTPPDTSTPPETSEPQEPVITPVATSKAKIYNAFKDQPLLGMNLSGNVYYSASKYYKDLMKSADPWRTSDDSGTRWENDTYFHQIPKRPDGYPTHVPFAVDGTTLLQHVVTPVSHSANRSLGVHHLYYQGEGQLQLNGARLVSEEPGHQIYDFGSDPAANHAIVLIISQSLQSNPIRGIEIVHEDDIASYKTQPFNDALKSDLGDVSVVRLMDLMFTNGNAASLPEHIPPVDYYTWNDCPGDVCDTTHFAGHPPQVLMALVTHLDTHAWLTIPHQATDAYVRQYAQAVYAGLPADKSVLVEYSNELWNWLFPQTHWLAEVACADPVSRVELEDSPGQCNGEISSRRYQTKRTLEIVNIFRDVFGEERDRVISVLAGQGSWSWRTQQSMEALADANINPHGQSFDAISIAPYFGGEHIATQDMRDFFVNTSFEGLRDHAINLIDSDEVLGGIQEHKQMADQYQADLIAYEGGQHFLCGGEFCEDRQLMDKLAAFQRHDVMEEVYNYYYQAWFDQGGSLFAVFSHLASPESRWGAWGTSEYYGQPLTETPKKRALQSALQTYRISGEAPTEPPEEPVVTPPEQPSEPPEEPTEPSDPVITPESTRKTYMFGHSLIYHQPADFNPNTTVPYWMGLFSEAASTGFSFSGQYGFLRNHASFPPRAQWGFNGGNMAWDDDSPLTFDQVNFDSILFTAANFIQYQAPDQPYDGLNDDNSSPLDATLAIIDQTLALEPGIDIYLYENWQDMSSVLVNDQLPPSPDALARYHAETINSEAGGFHHWWLDYHNRIMTLRPDANVKMIPVGPIISHLLTDTELSGIPFDDLYEDDAPHGRPTIYFLAGMITYMAMYSEMAPTHWTIPDSVHPLVAIHYDTVNQFIWNYLNSFNTPSAQSRVFN